MENDDLKQELREAQRAARRFQKKSDALRAQLGQPPLYEKKDPKFIVTDSAP
jgi:hypothetical protein